ncbi:MAG: cytochrome c3 family protein, partial [Candidatus Aminicenantia bacterium]
INLLILFIFHYCYARKDSCIECHRELEANLKKPVELMERDFHFQFGLSCSNCHGGDPLIFDERAMDKKYGFIGTPARDKIVELCSRCHSDPVYMRKFNPRIRVDQLELYNTSKHGILLEKGDRKVAVCSDCHSSHGILPSIDSRSNIFPQRVPETCGKCHQNKEYMKDYGIPTDQVDEFSKSVHGEALKKGELSAPACNDCHGNHGSTPPGVENISYVCRQCHASQGELFVDSPHREVFDSMDISECEACHGNHKIERPTDEMLNPGKGICSTCHEKGSKGMSFNIKIYSDINELKNKIDKAETLLKKVYKMGVEVSESFIVLQDAKASLTKARNFVHSLDIGEIENALKEGFKNAEVSFKQGEEGEKEALRRRKSFAVFLIFFLFLIVALYLRLRMRNKGEGN